MYRYILELQNIIADTRQVAMENSAASSDKCKRYFYRKARDRSFKVRDEVLVLLPSDSNKPLCTWLGPFTVKAVMYPDYKVLIKGKEKAFRASMLKKYLRRDNVLPTQSICF